MQPVNRVSNPRIKALKILVVDDEPYMRKVTRTILAAIGVTNILEAADGATGLRWPKPSAPISLSWIGKCR